MIPTVSNGIQMVSDLPLSKRDGRQFFVKLHLLGKLIEISGRVCARGEDEDERGGGGGVFEGKV